MTQANSPNSRFAPRRTRRVFLCLLLLLLAIFGVRALLGWRAYFEQESAQQNVKLAPLALTSRERILIVSPHLDDETLGAGGIIAQTRRAGWPVRVVFLSNGDGSGSTILAENFSKWRRTSYVEMAQMRQQEALRALQQLGVAASDVTFLGFPDGKLQTLWQSSWLSPTVSPTTGLNFSPYPNSFTSRAPLRGAQLLSDLTRATGQFRPTLLLTTHPSDTHPDHWSAWAFSNLALQVLATREASKSWVKRTRVAGFVVHHGVWPLPHGSHLQSRLVPPSAQMQQNTTWNEVALSPQNRESKRRALEEYGSQLVFTPHYLRAFVRINEPFGFVRAQQQSSRSIWRDEIGDSRGGSGSDLQSFELKSSSDGIDFRANFDAALRRDCEINVVFHAVKEGNVTPTHLQVLADTAQLPDGKTVRVQRTARAIQVKMSPRDLGVVRPDALLFSLQIKRGGRVVEQSESAVWTSQ